MTPSVSFSAIVGQENLKLALILAAVDPGINGVLLYGEKGTAKSTAARALARLLPKQQVIRGCQYGCDPSAPNRWCHACRMEHNRSEPQIDLRPTPFVEVPLNATEDRVLGGIDISRSLRLGTAVFQPGLLARANRGILYIDEINLLDVAILNAILDATASGWHRVEREGISVDHPSQFVLIGTMNPEEGELDPQIMDRMGLCVEVKGAQTLEERVSILNLHEYLETGGLRLEDHEDYRDKDLRKKISAAQRNISKIRVSREIRRFMAELTTSKNVEGHRADVILERAARALCALESREEVTTSDILKVAPIVLAHRAREEESSQEQRDKQDEMPRNEEQGTGQESGNPPPQDQSSMPGHGNSTNVDSPSGEDQEVQPHDATNPPGKEMHFEIGQEFSIKRLSVPKDRIKRASIGRRLRSLLKVKKGRWSGVTMANRNSSQDIAIDATLRAAAPRQCGRIKAQEPPTAFVIEPEDLRYKKRYGRASTLILFVVDASGSMGARARMVASKGAVMSLLLDAYRNRDKVAMISFKGTGANVDLYPTSSVEFAASCLRDLTVGGRTPLSAGLIAAHRLLAKALARDPLLRPIVILVTDGRANAPTASGHNPVSEAMKAARLVSSDPRVQFVVVDTEDPFLLRLGIAKRLADNLGASYFRIENLKSHDLISVINKERKRS